MSFLTPTNSFTTREELVSDLLHCGVSILEDPMTCGLLSCNPSLSNAGSEEILSSFLTEPQKRDETHIRYGRHHVLYAPAEVGAVCASPSEITTEESFDVLERGGIHIRLHKEIDCSGLQIDHAIKGGTCSRILANNLSNRVTQNLSIVRNSARLKMAQILFEDMIRKGEYSVLQTPNDFATYTTVESGIPREDLSGSTPWNVPDANILEYISELKCKTNCAVYDEMWMNCTTFSTLMRTQREQMQDLLSCEGKQNLLLNGPMTVITGLSGVKVIVFDRSYTVPGQSAKKWLEDGEIVFRVANEKVRHYALPNTDACMQNCVAENLIGYGEFINNRRHGFPTRYEAQYSNYFAFVAENPSAFFYLKAF